MKYIISWKLLSPSFEHSSLWRRCANYLTLHTLLCHPCLAAQLCLVPSVIIAENAELYIAYSQGLYQTDSRPASRLRQKSFSWRTTQIWEARRYFLLLAAVPDYTLHEGLHTWLGTHYTKANIYTQFTQYSSKCWNSPSPVRKVRDHGYTSRLQQGPWPRHLPILFWKRPHLPSAQMMLTYIGRTEAILVFSAVGYRLLLHSYGNCLHPKIDSTCRGWGYDPEMFSRTFQDESPQLAGKPVEFRVNNLRSLARITYPSSCMHTRSYSW